ncbi:MAG: hypothetical protein LBN93_08155 [Candidatus Symbiothrix sp.]|nr:hypothetical protein [Candidatus Symbiothrix sp.]
MAALLFFTVACSNDENLYDESIEFKDVDFERLSFSDEQSLLTAIKNGNSTAIQLRSGKPFISLLSKIPSNNSLRSSDETTYYEVLGYEELIPNPNFARLVNPNGELEVGTQIVKITPEGTYAIPIDKKDQFDALIFSDLQLQGRLIDEHTFDLGDGITLYETFDEVGDYEVISNGNYVLLPDNQYDNYVAPQAPSEPNFDQFPTFSPDRHTIVGKLIQSLIGSTKTHTIEFNSKRRIRGKFYFYNYFVYSEIGVSGWTDKKNWIGWSKTDADELRVGWRDMVIKRSIPNEYLKDLKKIQGPIYFPPAYMTIPGYDRRVNVATLVVPDYKATLFEKVISIGAKAISDYIKSELKQGATNIDKATGFIIVDKTTVRVITLDESRIKYNEDSYTHVFDSQWNFNFQISWNSQSGFSVGSVHSLTDAINWGKAIQATLNAQTPTLESGEVYVCGRFGADWRGMRIIKK